MITNMKRREAGTLAETGQAGGGKNPRVGRPMMQDLQPTPTNKDVGTQPSCFFYP